MYHKTGSSSLTPLVNPFARDTGLNKIKRQNKKKWASQHWKHPCTAHQGCPREEFLHWEGGLQSQKCSSIATLCNHPAQSLHVGDRDRLGEETQLFSGRIEVFDTNTVLFPLYVAPVISRIIPYPLSFPACLLGPAWWTRAKDGVSLEARTGLGFPGLGEQKTPLPEASKVRMQLRLRSKETHPARQVRI